MSRDGTGPRRSHAAHLRVATGRPYTTPHCPPSTSGIGLNPRVISPTPNVTQMSMPLFRNMEAQKSTLRTDYFLSYDNGNAWTHVYAALRACLRHKFHHRRLAR